MKTIFKSLGCLFWATIFSLSFFGCTQEPTNELASIEITSLPNKTTYFIGEELDTAGLEVTAKYTIDSPRIVTGWIVSGFDSSSTTESQVVTVRYTEGEITKTADFKIQIVSKSLTKIEIVRQPTKKEYFVGQEFDPTGLSVKAYYDDGSDEIVTGWTISGFDSSKAASSKTVTVSYAGPGATKTATFEVIIKEKSLTKIEIVSQPTKKEYFVGQEFDSTGLSVKAYYDDGSNEIVTGWTISGFDSSKSAASKTVTVSYAGHGATKTATLTVTIKEKSLTKIEIASQPTKKEYFIGQKLDSAGLSVKAYYDDGSNEIVTGWTISGFDSSKAVTSKTVTVSYAGPGATKTATFTVTIKEKSLTKIEIASQPTKKEYFVGQEFDPTGLSVKAYYDDGSNEIVVGWITDFDSNSAVTSKTVTVSYTKLGITKTATFTVEIIGLKSISITKQPTVSEYYVGDKLDTRGMEVTATYTNNTTKVVTDYTINATDCSLNDEYDSITYTVSHSVYGATKTATFNGKMKWHNAVEVLPSGTDGTLGVTGKYVLFGDFPQTIKASSVTISETKTKAMGYLTYCLGSDGNWYAMCTENAYFTENYSDGTVPAKKSANSTKYFKVEPIKWRVLTDSYSGKSLLLAETILTGNIPYYEYWRAHRNGSYQNNYKDSQIRAYLNGISYNAYDATDEDLWKNIGFLQTAFTATACAKIAETDVDNSAASTFDARKISGLTNSYACGNTKDKIFLLSEKEVTTTSYGFTASDDNTGNSRLRMATDFAKANYIADTCWWLRSPYDSDDQTLCVDTRTTGPWRGYWSYIGVVPAFSISIQ